MSKTLAPPLEGKSRDSAVSVPLPAYPDHEVPDLSARLQNLTLKGANNSQVPETAHLIAHLKFLEALYKLREDIGARDGLFGIASPREDLRTSENQVRVLEKRWAVYVTRAVDRFERWYNTCAPATDQGVKRGKTTLTDFRKRDFDKMYNRRYSFSFDRDELPPLGK